MADDTKKLRRSVDTGRNWQIPTLPLAPRSTGLAAIAAARCAQHWLAAIGAPPEKPNCLDNR